MIKISLRFIFVLVYKSTYLWSESEKRNHFRECFVLFNELFIFAGFFLPRNILVIRKNGDYCTVIIGLFKLYV